MWYQRGPPTRTAPGAAPPIERSPGRVGSRIISRTWRRRKGESAGAAMLGTMGHHPSSFGSRRELMPARKEPLAQRWVALQKTFRPAWTSSGRLLREAPKGAKSMAGRRRGRGERPRRLEPFGAAIRGPSCAASRVAAVAVAAHRHRLAVEIETLTVWSRARDGDPPAPGTPHSEPRRPRRRAPAARRRRIRSNRMRMTRPPQRHTRAWPRSPS